MLRTWLMEVQSGFDVGVQVRCNDGQTSWLRGDRRPARYHGQLQIGGRSKAPIDRKRIGTQMFDPHGGAIPPQLASTNTQVRGSSGDHQVPARPGVGKLEGLEAVDQIAEHASWSRTAGHDRTWASQGRGSLPGWDLSAGIKAPKIVSAVALCERLSRKVGWPSNSRAGRRRATSVLRPSSTTCSISSRPRKSAPGRRRP